MHFDDITIEMARIEREAYERAVAKVRAGQLGEAFQGLPFPADRRGTEELQRAA